MSGLVPSIGVGISVSASMDMDLGSFVCVPRNGAARPYGDSIFSFFEETAVFHGCCSHHQQKQFLFSQYPC